MWTVFIWMTPFAKRSLPIRQGCCARNTGSRSAGFPKDGSKSRRSGRFFRGQIFPLLAKRIDSTFGNAQGFLNAALIGEAARDALTRPKVREDVESDTELFQYFKQLWHTLAYFG